MMRDGECAALPMLVPLTDGSASGLSLPTPVKYDSTPGGPGNHYKGLGHMAKHSWPTPTKSDHKGPNMSDGNSASTHSLATVVAKSRQSCPTPTVSGNHNVKGASPTSGDGLAAAVGKTIGRGNAGGHLNPEWVEWLMGWPIGWTALQPLEMGRFREWQNSHGKR